MQVPIVISDLLCGPKLHPWCSHNNFLTIGIYLIQKSFFVEILKIIIIIFEKNMNNYFLNVKLFFKE
jgi:quinol-cytochrome oxidoreductase complex cytochrome b subunit